MFKSVESIVNKMWRKSEETRPTVSVDGLSNHIKDLIRTDVRTDTLSSAPFLALRMNNLPNVLHDKKVRSDYEKNIKSCVFEPEMKMASGYFAYHGLIEFLSGHFVEVQIYSLLTNSWRKLSHLLYEKARINPNEHHEFASPSTRLISLGHMLHLAECELQRLIGEMKVK